MIAHLRGREAALEPFGWTGRQAEWIALACLHSGVFTRTQATRFLDTHHERARRLVHALIAQGLAAEETVPGVRGIGRVCRIFSRVYTARSEPSTSATAARRPPTCSCAACSRSTTCSSTPACRGSRPSWRRSARSRRSASSAGSCPRGSTAEPPATRGVTSRSSCRSRSKLGARRVRLRRSRARYHDGAPLLGRGTSRPLGSAAGAQGRSIEVVAVVRTVEGAAAGPDDPSMNWTNTSTASGPSAVPEPDSAARSARNSSESSRPSFSAQG